MPFDLRLDGEVIASVDEQVTGVRIQTSRGETSVTGIAPHEGVVDIILDRVAAGGPPRLDQIESAAMQAIRDRSEEGQVVGYTRDFQVHPSGLRQDQGMHEETLREGGINTRLTRQTRSNGSVPSRDLAEGLNPNDVETRTRRLEAFADHGDTDRAISENQPWGVGRDETSGSGETNVYPGTANDSISSSESTVGGQDDTSSSSGGDDGPSGPDAGAPSEGEGSTPATVTGGEGTTSVGTSEEKTDNDAPPGITLEKPSGRKVKDNPQA